MALDDIEAPFYRFDTKISQPWFDWKKKVKEHTGLQMSANYSSTFIGASSRISEDNQQTAASGIFDATLNWNFINRKKGKNQGNLIFWVDSRHLYYGSVPAQMLNFETGSATLPALKFGQWSFRTLEFYYQQQVFNGRMGIVVGKIDMADWFTYHGLLHPMMHFSDYAFSVSPTVQWSNVGLGLVVGGWLDKQKRFGIVAGLNDVAGDDISENKFLDWGTSNFKDGNFLKMVELVYTPAYDKYYFNRITATFWHGDATEGHNSFSASPSTKGFTVQGTWMIQNKWIPTFTFGLSDGKGTNSISKLNISAMHAWLFPSRDMLGIGLNYTESVISGTGQFLNEIFYRFTLSKAVVLTPSIKTIIKPALNPEKSFLFYYGIRTRISF